MRNIKLLLSYDGTDFSGWQRQPDRRTVQQVLEEAIGRLTGVEPPTNASGRTDAGVHALGQVVHFYTASRHAPEVFVKALNATLPPDVRVKGAWEMPAGVPRDARRQGEALPLRDRQRPDRRPVPDSATPGTSTSRSTPPRCTAPRRRSKGRHDFHSFETHWPNRTSSVRTITHIAVSRMNDFVWVDVEADGFLYNMVRSIAGTLVVVGKGQWPESRVAEALAAEDRREAGPTAPPQGCSSSASVYT